MEKLNDNLIALTKPFCNESKIIKGEHYRISVIAPHIIRVEVNTENKFLDEATQSVWYRDFYSPKFKTEEEGKYLLIVTEKVT
jgi:hypothetical protein